MDTVTPPADRALYEADEHAWIARQIAALRSGRLEDLDRDSLVEYLTDMTLRDHRELASRFVVLLHHLLKVRFQPGRLSRSWILTIINQQREIRQMLTGIPSLRTHAPRFFADAYNHAVRLAATETGIPRADFPPQPPWTIDEALDFTVEMPPAPPRRGARKT